MPKPLQDFLTARARLWALFNLGFAWPVFAALWDAPTFYLSHRAGLWEIAAFAAILLAVVPWVVLSALPAAFGAGLSAAAVAWTLMPDAAGEAGFAAGAIAGVAFALFYRRSSNVRFFTLLLAPALVVLPAVYAASPGVRAIAGITASLPAPSAPAPKPVPVVWFVFDEFALSTLLDESGQVDAEKFPNFAALSRDSAWFRGAVTVSDNTFQSLPAMWTGRYPNDRIPTFAHYSENLFTLTSGTYEWKSYEPETRLCPPTICGEESKHSPAAMVLDSAAIWLHEAMPPALRGDFHVTARTAHFIGDNVPGIPTHDRRKAFEEFLNRIEPPASGAKPVSYAMHALLPHVPWEYFPSGVSYQRQTIWRRWGADLAAAKAADPSYWGPDAELVRLSQGRYVLQAAYVDALLGKLVARLRETGLYDEAILVVTSDHGVSFRPDQHGRNAFESNYGDIVPVPLFIRAPGLEKGIRDGAARTIDILPTVAELTGIDTAGFDGVSLLTPPAPRATIEVHGKERGVLFFSQIPAALDESVRRHRSLFGPGPVEKAVFERAELDGLYGRPAAPLETAPAQWTSARIRGEGAVREARPSQGLVPALVDADVTGLARGAEEWAAGTAGVVWAYARVERSGMGGKLYFLLPERAFVEGKNEISLWQIRRTAAGIRLTPVLPEVSSARASRERKAGI